MRVPLVFVVIVAIIGGYFVSIPLFGHQYGILRDGKTTYILREKDAVDCKAQLIKSTEPAIASEPEELPPEDIKQAEPACDFVPPEAVAWDWFYLLRTLASHSANGKKPSLPMAAIGDVLTSRSTLEIATGAALVGSFFFLLELLASLTRRRVRQVAAV